MNIQFTNEDWNEINKSTVYSYTGKKAKSHTTVMIISTMLIFSFIAILAFLTVSEKFDNGMLAILFIVLFLLVVVYIVKELQFNTMKALTQYYVDSDKNCYKIKFTKVSTKVVRVNKEHSLIPLVGEVKTFLDAMEKLRIKENYMMEAYQDAQSKALGYYYVKRFKQGIMDWNWFRGGEAKVIYLGKNVKIPEDYKS